MQRPLLCPDKRLGGGALRVLLNPLRLSLSIHPVTSSRYPTATCASLLPYLAYLNRMQQKSKADLARLNTPIVRLLPLAWRDC